MNMCFLEAILTNPQTVVTCLSIIIKISRALDRKF